MKSTDTDALVLPEELVPGVKKVFLYLLSSFTQKTTVYNAVSIEFMCSGLMYKEQQQK